VKFLKEDSMHHELKKISFLGFILQLAGIITVFLAICSEFLGKNVNFSSAVDGRKIFSAGW
jgi:hypothetical protein